MMMSSKKLLLQAITKAESAYGAAVKKDLDAALENILQRQGWLDACMKTMAINQPKALLWQNLQRLQQLTQG